ncbi:RecQ family ATP-dependent DNA helicase [Persicirhabdus sediminis]|uniref:ATP-dependent DNA helicase RecQ n=1 Tax=Persicirhabdus sediminis TaxID=454144 RepID=A0A8J7MDN1_9BACT|nr:ATP-dependent DNA helicase RecQ [Persicirhabdus sediminis]MBK1791904.1 ATP-dependent DNA helicase RecQ [Persicirhabdus sediminis]
MSSTEHREPLQVLKHYFGFEGFVGTQDEVVKQILQRKDGLVVMPTGGGKSLCYQLPALCLDGVALVVSPLIALMKDQVDALVARGIPATMINSTLSWAEQKERLNKMSAGDYKLVYVAPERFRAESFMSALERVNISLLAVDEAHCLSQWGHDFRPDYMRLGNVLESLGRPQCIALTATATKVVRDDILKVLALRDPFEMISGFSRPNLSLNINSVDKVSQKFTRLRKVIKEHKTGIVYCATRKRVEEVSEMLTDWGMSCIAYHGGMSDQERETTQNVFINKKADVAVATNAFGMGIDRSDVRFVVHFEIPGSVEAYYQEAGRAGRDGEASYCELLFNYADTRTQEFFIEGVNPSYKTICDVYQYMLNHADKDYQLVETLDQIKEGAGVKNGIAVGSALGVLIRHRYVERYDVPGQRAKGTRLLQPQVLTSQLAIDKNALEEKSRRDREKLDAMVRLCYSHNCRQQWILDYFGDPSGERCGDCDQCRGESSGDLRAPVGEEVTIVRKALSGVARMSRRTNEGWEGRFGRGRIVQMLMGSRSQDILRLKLDTLTTYGILQSLGTAYVNGLFRSLHDGGLIYTQKGEYPLIALTPLGDKVMRGEADFQLCWPDEKGLAEKNSSSSAGVQLEELGFDPVLFDKLKMLRNALAKSQGVKAYEVFSNKTLEQFTRLRPKTIAQGEQVRGVGGFKAERYLQHFVQAIADYEREYL